MQAFLTSNDGTYVHDAPVAAIPMTRDFWSLSDQKLRVFGGGAA
jgi:uncharacterized protein YjeT (DUF2065 family)